MDKRILTLILFVAVLFLPVVAYAMVDSIQSLSIAIANVVWVIFGLVAVVMFVAAGIMFLTAQGQPEKLQMARSAVIWGIAGVVVAILAYSIITIISNILQ